MLSAKGGKQGGAPKDRLQVLPTLTETEPQEKGTHELVFEKLLISRGGLSAATKTLSNPTGPWDNPNRCSRRVAGPGFL